MIYLLYQANLVYNAGNDTQMVDILYFYVWGLSRFIHSSIKYLNSYSYLRNAGGMHPLRVTAGLDPENLPGHRSYVGRTDCKMPYTITGTG